VCGLPGAQLFVKVPQRNFRVKKLTPGRDNPMAIPKELLEILVCPACRTRVELTQDCQGLKCPTCRRVYPIRDDIPVMIVEEATIEPQ